jgi:SulP family sulfate permease
MDGPRSVRSDALAGLINAVVSVPDGLASAALAGVNPVYGLYTSVAAPIAGSWLVSAQLMQIATTSAASIAAGQAIAGYPVAERDGAIFLLAVVTGGFLGCFALLRFGRLVRFVPHAVMTGFLIGVAVVLILDQSAPLVGGAPKGPNEVVQFIDLIAHLNEIDAPTVVIGVAAIGIIAALKRTRVAVLSSLFALVVPTILVVLVGLHSVERVADVNPIPRGIPAPALPDLALLSPGLVLAALALAVVIAVQGAGVSQSVDNPDGRPISASRDMLAQGAANVASGLFSGIPAGGSVGQTALNVSVGARSRLSGIFGGLWMLAIVLLMPGLVGQVPMTVLAALMIVAGVSAIDVGEARSIWNTGGTARWLIVATFIATLVMSVPAAVAVGVLLASVLYIRSSASDVRIRALVLLDDGRFVEQAPPERLPSHEVTVLDVYGSLFFAGARTLLERLPSPRGAARPAVVLRLRGRTTVGSTLVDVLDEYAESLAEVDGRLYLSGVDDTIARLLERTRKLDLSGTVRMVRATEVLGESTRDAIASARRWLNEASDE